MQILPQMQSILQIYRRGLISLPRQRSLLRIEGLERSTKRFGTAELVLSRALCRYQRFDLSRLPAAKRRAALGLQLQQWSPYAANAQAVIWKAGVASVWCWDRAALGGYLEQAGWSETRLRIIPESLLRGPTTDGLRLVKCLDGVEAQYWLGTELLNSRWWPSTPADSELLAFQRDCGLHPDQQVSSAPVEEIALAPLSWAAAEYRAGAQQGELSQAEMLIYAALTLALGLPAIALGIEQTRLSRASAQQDEAISGMRAASRSVLDARETALTSRARIKLIDGLQRYSEPFALMVAVSHALTDGAFVKEWEMSDGRLKLLIASPSADISGAAYVSALERSGLFSQVKALTQADSKQMGFVMDLVPKEAITAAGLADAPISATGH